MAFRFAATNGAWHRRCYRLRHLPRCLRDARSPAREHASGLITAGRHRSILQRLAPPCCPPETEDGRHPRPFARNEWPVRFRAERLMALRRNRMERVPAGAEAVVIALR